MFDLLVLSPHLDDAALSCGGSIFQTTRAGGRVFVVTIFAGDEPAEPPSPLARDLARWWALPVGGIMSARRAEDEAACRRLGAVYKQWDLSEAPYRRDLTTGQILYPSLAALYARRQPESREPELGAVLVDRLRALPPARRVLAPLGVGGHVDHLLVEHAAAEVFGEDLHFYEEYPYAQWKRLAVWRATRPRPAWWKELVRLAPEDVAARCAAIACYRSQLEAMFKGERRMERLVRRYVRRVGGERFWRRLA